MDMPKHYSELRKLRRGHELIYRGIRTRCVYCFGSEAGGVGMGEYPARFWAVFENGLVLEADEWTHKVHVKEQPFREVSPDF